MEVPISDAIGKILPVLWVLKIKRTPWGKLKKYKGRFTARGDLQEKKGYEEEYSPVGLWASIRIIFLLGLSWWIEVDNSGRPQYLGGRVHGPVARTT